MTDAWKQLDDLEEKYTKEVEVRPDLVVTALGLERGVMFTLLETDHDYDTLDKRHYRHHSTQRNVSTMRELAQALLDACDFVEQANPKWAGLGSARVTVSHNDGTATIYTVPRAPIVPHE